MGVDVSDEKQVGDFVRLAFEQSGRLDYVFNIAGIHIAGDYHDFGNAEWRRVLDLNLWGVIHGTRAAYEIMREQRHGHIFNMGSLSGITPTPMQAPYAASKADTLGLAVEVAGGYKALAQANISLKNKLESLVFPEHFPP